MCVCVHQLVAYLMAPAAAAAGAATLPLLTPDTQSTAHARQISITSCQLPLCLCRCLWFCHPKMLTNCGSESQRCGCHMPHASPASTVSTIPARDQQQFVRHAVALFALSLWLALLLPTYFIIPRSKRKWQICVTGIRAEQSVAATVSPVLYDNIHMQYLS